MKILKKLIPFVLILVLSFFAFKPLLVSGFFPMHDDTQPARVFEMANALKDGMFPVRWSGDLGFGYGYPIFNFYAPLAYYVGSFFILVGLNPLDATKAMMIIGILLSGFAMYILAKELFGKLAGLIASLLYLYAPYHAVNVYIRGDVAEFYAYGFVPLVFWGLYMVYKKNEYKFIFLSALFFSLVIISHNLTAFIITPFYILFSVFLFIKDKSRFNLFLPLILGVLLSSFYWIPALLEMNYTNVTSQIGGGANFKDHFVCLSQLWTSDWGFGGSTKGCVDGISFMIGKYHILTAAIGIFVLLFYFLKQNKKKENEDIVHTSLMFLVLGVLSIFLMLSASEFIWNLIKPMEYIQYPWRFLIVTSFSFSIIGASLFWVLKKIMDKKTYSVIVFLACIAVVFLNTKFFEPQTIVAKTSSDYVSKSALNWDISKITSEYMPKGFNKPKDSTEVASFNSIENEDVAIKGYYKKTNRIELNLLVNKQSEIIIPLAYFPAWKATANGKNVKTEEASRGTKVNLPAGNINLLLSYKQTPIETLGNVLSLSGVLLLALGIIKVRK